MLSSRVAPRRRCRPALARLVMCSLVAHVVVVAAVVKLATLPVARFREILLAAPHVESDVGDDLMLTARAPTPAPLELPPRTDWPTRDEAVRAPVVAARPRGVVRDRIELSSPTSVSVTHTAAVDDRTTRASGERAAPGSEAGRDGARETAQTRPELETDEAATSGGVAPLEISLHTELGPRPAVPLAAAEKIPTVPAHEPGPALADAAQSDVPTAPATSPKRTSIPWPEPSTPIAARGDSMRATPADRGSSAEHQPGLALGLGLERVRIQVEGGAERTTRKGTETIAGSIVGGSTVQATIVVNGSALPLSIQDRRFQLDVALQPGANSVRVVAVGAEGMTAEATVSIQYTPPPADGVAITVPADGLTLARHDPPIVVVHGRVEDPAVSSISLLVNRTRLEVPVRDGAFQQPVPIVEPAVSLVAEAARDGAPLRRSASITVRAPVDASPTAVLLVDWGSAGAPAGRGIRGIWRGRPDRLEGPSAPITVSTVPPLPGSSIGIFYVRDLRPGAYTFVADTDALPRTATLYVPVAGAMAARQPRQLHSSPGGRVTLARVLLPFGVLWDQDDWFEGRSESSETITKFNADGVTWIERRSDLR